MRNHLPLSNNGAPPSANGELTAIRRELRAIRRLLARQVAPVQVTINQPPLTINQPPPVPLPPSGQPKPFVPTLLQRDILRALQDKALRTDALAAACDVDRRQLFRPGGLPELRERGLVGHHRKVGFYSTGAPPPGIEEWDVAGFGAPGSAGPCLPANV
jgi:hypothetical protein